MIDTTPYTQALELDSIEEWLTGLDPEERVGEPGIFENCVLATRLRAVDPFCDPCVRPHYTEGKGGKVEVRVRRPEDTRSFEELPLPKETNLLAEVFDHCDFSAEAEAEQTGTTAEGCEGLPYRVHEDWDGQVTARQALVLVRQVRDTLAGKTA